MSLDFWHRMARQFIGGTGFEPVATRFRELVAEDANGCATRGEPASILHSVARVSGTRCYCAICDQPSLRAIGAVTS